MSEQVPLVLGGRQVLPLLAADRVVIAGRAPLHVAKWALRADPSSAAFQVVGEQIGSPPMPCDISPGAEQIFFMYLDGAVNLRRSLESVEDGPQRIVATVSSGGRTCLQTHCDGGAIDRLGDPRRVLPLRFRLSVRDVSGLRKIGAGIVLTMTRVSAGR